MDEKRGLLGNVEEDVTNKKVIPVFSGYGGRFSTDDVVVFLDPITGLKVAGPVKVLTYDVYGGRLVVTSGISAPKGTAIYISGEQTETSPPVV